MENFMGYPRGDRTNTTPQTSGRKAEAKLAKRVGGKTNPGSGAVGGFKGDIRVGVNLVECKATVKESMTVKYSWLAKIAQEATFTAKTPALSIQFVTLNGEPKQSGSWVLIPEHLYNEVLSSDK